MSFLNEHHLQKTLFANDAEIQNLISEKKVETVGCLFDFYPLVNIGF